MYRLNLPQYDIKIGENHGRYDILDILRRKYVALTPEEWVRQHFIHYLIEHKGYPAAYLTNEIELKSSQETAVRQCPLRHIIASPHDYRI